MAENVVEIKSLPKVLGIKNGCGGVDVSLRGVYVSNGVLLSPLFLNCLLSLDNSSFGSTNSR